MKFGGKLFAFSGFLIGAIKGILSLVLGDVPCTYIGLVEVIITKLIYIFINKNRNHYNQSNIAN